MAQPQQSWLSQLLSSASDAATASGIPIVQSIPTAVKYALTMARQQQAAHPQQQAPQTVTDVLKRSAQAGWQTVGQVPAGLASVTVANDARPHETGATVHGYRPAIADAVPAAVGAIKTLAHAVAPSYVDAPATGGYLANSMARMQQADDNTNSTLGITAPQNPVETGLNLAGSLAVPLPGADALGALGKAGKLGKVAQTAAELALPLRQGSFGQAAKTVLPVGVALSEGVKYLTDGASGEPTSNQPSQANQVPNNAVGTGQGTAFQADDPFAAMERDAGLGGLTAHPLMSADEQLQTDFAQQHEDTKQSSWTTAGEVLAAGGVGLLGVAGFKVAKALIAKAPATALDLDSVIGQKNIKSNLSPAQRLNTGVFDSSLPIQTNANTFLQPAYARKLNYKLDTISNSATGAQVRAFMTSGDAPLASRTYTPVAHILEPMAQELQPAQQTMLGDALLFASSLDDIKRTGVQASFNEVQPADMQKLVDYVKNDPTMGKHFTNIQQSFADHLQYEVDIGKRSVADAAKFRNDNPNYVPFARDQVTDADNSLGGKLYNPRTDANQQVQSDLARNVDAERAGVQKGAVRNPIDLLPDMWRDSIVAAKQNDLRSQYLGQLAENLNAKTVDNNKPLVVRLQDGEISNSPANTHTVFELGRKVDYIVNDPALNTALKFNSRASFKMMDSWRQVVQQMTTGTLGSLTSGFQFAVAPVYDTAIGMLFKEKGVHLGNINEMLAKVNPSLSIGRLDPTQIFGAYTGALRYMFDDFTHQAASNLTNQLMRDNSFLRQAIGDNAVTALRDKLQQAYEGSVKSLGEEQGVFSHMMRGSPDSATASSGLEDIAPQYTSDSAIRAAQSAYANGSKYQAILATSKVPFIAARTSAIGRFIQTVTEATHNGFRYSALAANKSRISDLDELAATMRRISVDSSQHGSNDLLNGITGSTVYANITMQTSYDLARRIAADPMNVGMNFATVLGGYAAMRYMSLADPEVMARDKEKTTAQRLRTVSLPGGAELPVEPIMRVPWGLASTFFDHVSGHDVGNYNPAFLSAIGSWFDMDKDKIGDEKYHQDLHDAFTTALQDNAPITPEQIPLVATAEAAAGLNPSLAKVTGQPSLVHGQTYSGFDSDKKFVGGLTSAYFENLVSTAIGSFAQHTLETADEVWRASGHYKGPMDAVRDIGAKWKDDVAGSAKLFKPILFGQYENVKSVGDTNFNLMKQREDGIKSVLNIYKKDVMAEALSGSALDPRYSDILEDGMYQLDPKYIGTPLQTIGMYTKVLDQQNRPFALELAALSNESQRVQADTTTPIEARNKKVNVINEKRKALTYQQLMYTRQMEDQIGTAIGDDHFTYQGFDPSKYMQPSTPAAPQSQSPAP